MQTVSLAIFNFAINFTKSRLAVDICRLYLQHQRAWSGRVCKRIACTSLLRYKRKPLLRFFVCLLRLVMFHRSLLGLAVVAIAIAAAATAATDSSKCCYKRFHRLAWLLSCC